VTSPNQYHLQGDGIAVSYYPDGSGPPVAGRGRLRLVYQDTHQAQSFYDDDLRTVAVPDLGSVVSVTIVKTIDTGDTTFSVLVPDVQLPDQQNSAHVHTEGIATMHRIFVAAIGHPQTETYSVTPLCGTATAGILPD
jgi:hypothetical protein